MAQAFQDVANAMSDREKMINEARAYQNNLIPKARGDARTLLSEAEAYKQQRIAEAVGTPVYVYSHATLSHHFRVFDGAFSAIPHVICYSVKANPNVRAIKRVPRTQMNCRGFL